MHHAVVADTYGHTAHQAGQRTLKARLTPAALPGEGGRKVRQGGQTRATTEPVPDEATTQQQDG